MASSRRDGSRLINGVAHPRREVSRFQNMTNDRQQTISDARLQALEELAAMDQELELKYGIVGNPMIKAQERTPGAQPTPGECRVPNE